MIKRYLLLFLLLVQFTTSAQLIVYREKFDDMSTYAITGWPYEFTGMVPWQVGLPYQLGECMLPVGGPMSIDVGTNKVACIADCGTWNPNDSNVFSYTPAISLSGITGAWLKYDSYYEHYTDGADTEKATVEISTDTGATWTVLQVVPANPSLSNFYTQYIDLSVYNNVPNLRIGFRYSDGGGWMQGWAIDNVTVFVPARHDIALLSVTPNDTLASYVQSGYAYIHQVQVYNAGLDTIYSFVLSYTQGSGPIYNDTITGLSLPPFSTTTIGHSLPDSVFSQGTFKVTMWATLDSDAYFYNDTAVTYIRGAAFVPVKRLAIESGEGTWNGWSPRNMVDLASIPGHDIQACLISVHEFDPMIDSPYHDFLLNLRWDYVPYILFDRRTKVPIDSFSTYLDIQKSYFGFAALSLTGTLDGNSLTVSVDINPAIDLHGDFRLALVITENGVTGPSPGYDQVNNYAGGAYGPMGGYESLPNPVPAANMTYNFVARQITPAPDGVAGILPTDMTVGNTYSSTLTTTIDPAWEAGRLNATVLLIRHDDSTILNANQLPFALKTINQKASTLGMAGVYPNPASENANLYFDLSQDEPVKIVVTDMAGRTLYKCPVTAFRAGRNTVSIPANSLPNGIYLVNLLTDDGNRSLKLEVMH